MPPIQLQDPGGEPLEEGPVMGHEEKGGREPEEESLQGRSIRGPQY